MSTLRRLVAALCLVAILALAISPVAPSLLVALLTPLLFLFAPVAISLTGLKPEDDQLPALQFFAVTASRGPPNA